MGGVPDDLKLDSDKSFTRRFEKEGGYGISESDLDM